MDPDSRVELRFGRAAVECDRQALNDFPGIGTDHMTAEHAIGGLIHDKLHHRPLVSPR